MGLDYTRVACGDMDPGLFDEEHPLELVRAACRGCPVRPDCLTAFWREQHGTFGGLTRTERKWWRPGMPLPEVPAGRPGEVPAATPAWQAEAAELAALYGTQAAALALRCAQVHVERAVDAERTRDRLALPAPARVLAAAH